MATIAPALALLASPVLQGSFAPPLLPDLPEIRLEGVRTDRETRLTVPVTIEGKGPFRFVIDTGSQTTVVADSLAARLGLRSGPMVRVVSVAGIEQVATAEIDLLAIGDLSVTAIRAPLFESQHIGADGIIGTDSLQDRLVLLDFRENAIAVSNGGARSDDRGYEIVVRARRRAGQLIMTGAQIDGVRTAVIVDTGAGTSVGNRALQNALERRGNVTGQVTLTSVTGQKVSADLGVARRLAVNNLFITGLVIAFTDTPAFTELGLDSRPALFLGMRELRLFRRIAVDFRRSRILFDLPAKP